MLLARANDHCALTLSATFIVWKQGTTLQKKENTDGIVRFEKQQKEIEAVMQQSQKYRESLEAEKAALVRKYERLAAESRSSEIQMEKDVKDMKQKLEESLRVAEQFHQQLLSQKANFEDTQRSLEHQIDDIRIKLSTAEGKKQASQTKLQLIEKDVRNPHICCQCCTKRSEKHLIYSFCSLWILRLSSMLKLSKSKS
jgi:chromosome segregation ATPase